MILIGGLLSAAALWAVFIGPWPVRETSLQDDPAYRATVATFEQAKLPHPDRGKLSVGWSRVPITPTVPTHTAGYGAVLAQAVADSIYARAIAFRLDTSVAILIGIDALIVSRQMSQAVTGRLAASLGIRADRILFTATHTHSGPGNWDASWLGERFAGPFDRRRLEYLTAQMTTAAERAYAASAPAQMAFGSFEAARYVRNRLLKNLTDIDRVFTWAAFRHDDGTMAVWGAFAAHATTIAEEAAVISGDYPGMWERSLEADPADVALFSAGAVGSMGPRGEGHDVERARSVGLPLADSVRARLAGAEWRGETTLLAFRVHVVLPDQQVRPQGLFGEAGRWKLSPLLTRRLLPVRDTYVHVLALDRLVLVGMPCDYSGELAHTLRLDAQVHGFTLAATSFNGDYIGYAVRDEHYRLDTYETRTMSWWGPHMGSFLTDVAWRSVALAIERTAGTDSD